MNTVTSGNKKTIELTENQLFMLRMGASYYLEFVRNRLKEAEVAGDFESAAHWRNRLPLAEDAEEALRAVTL